MHARQARRTVYDNLDENVQIYGTPFPALEEGQNVSKKQQELDQTVRDEQGRRRLHGAFTGGWSAGYFNSVGTKEGWAPSQFVSRKNDRTQRKDYKPEDFMDDEDFSEHGIAPKQVKAKDDFTATTDSFAGFRNRIDKEVSSIDDVLKDVITPKSIPIGAQILKRMKKNAIQKLSKEHFLNNDKVFPLEFDENDIKNFFMNPKKDLNGLGYKRLTTNVNFKTNARLEQDSKPEFTTLMKDGKKLKISGEAFGCGALEEDDGYEAEVYTFDDLSKYDYSLGGNKQQKSGRLFNSILSHTNLMDDFRRSDEHLINRSNVNVIKVPDDWAPKPPTQKNIIKKRKSRWEPTEEKRLKNQEDIQKVDTKHKKLDANRRAEILGEDSMSLEREEIELELKKKIKEEQQYHEIKSSISEEQVQVFKKPLSGFFANKFVQSTNTPLDLLKPGLTTIENLPQTAKTPKTDLYSETKSFVGKSNREIYQFHPHKLICKRFNVPHPYPQFPEVVGVLAMNKPKQDPDSFFPVNNTLSTSKSQNAQQTIVKKEEITQIIEEFTKPDMNLFRAVFDQSDEDDLSEIEEIVELEDNETTTNNQDNLDRAKPDSKVISALSTDTHENTSKIMFNRAFVKKDASVSRPVECKQEKATKKNLFSLNPFENEDLGSDDEGVNLLELKKKSKESRLNSLSVNESKEKDGRSPEIKIVENELTDKGQKAEKKLNDCEFIVKKRKLATIDDDKFENKLDQPGQHSEESENSCNVDDLLNEIMNPESSHHHKKKKKKHKEHKKHKKKKHKSTRKSD